MLCALEKHTQLRERRRGANTKRRGGARSATKAAADLAVGLGRVSTPAPSAARVALGGGGGPPLPVLPAQFTTPPSQPWTAKRMMSVTLVGVASFSFTMRVLQVVRMLFACGDADFIEVRAVRRPPAQPPCVQARSALSPPAATCVCHPAQQPIHCRIIATLVSPAFFTLALLVIGRCFAVGEDTRLLVERFWQNFLPPQWMDYFRKNILGGHVAAVAAAQQQAAEATRGAGVNVDDLQAIMKANGAGVGGGPEAGGVPPAAAAGAPSSSRPGVRNVPPARRSRKGRKGGGPLVTGTRAGMDPMTVGPRGSSGRLRMETDAGPKETSNMKIY